jgi:hypothetical protein
MRSESNAKTVRLQKWCTCKIKGGTLAKRYFESLPESRNLIPRTDDDDVVSLHHRFEPMKMR